MAWRFVRQCPSIAGIDTAKALIALGELVDMFEYSAVLRSSDDFAQARQLIGEERWLSGDSVVAPQRRKSRARATVVLFATKPIGILELQIVLANNGRVRTLSRIVTAAPARVGRPPLIDARPIAPPLPRY